MPTRSAAPVERPGPLGPALASDHAPADPMDFTAVDLRIATVAEAEADGDALRLVLDLGGVRREAVTHVTENYGPADVLGTQVVVAMAGPEPVVLAAVSPSEGAVLLRPDRPVSDGTQVV